VVPGAPLQVAWSRIGGPGEDVLIEAEGEDCLVATDGSGGDKLKGNKGFDRYEADPGDDVDGSNEQEANCLSGG
jgi:hypothetical protein